MKDKKRKRNNKNKESERNKKREEKRKNKVIVLLLLMMMATTMMTTTNVFLLADFKPGTERLTSAFRTTRRPIISRCRSLSAQLRSIAFI